MSLTVEQPITKEKKYKICFVCLGNICRSPTAEGVFQHLIDEQGLSEYFEIDSAGTSAYHIGEAANSNSQRTANEHGVRLESKARQFRSSDLDDFDLVLAMDDKNYANILRLAAGRHKDTIGRLRDFDPDPAHGEVPDPYAGGMEGFANVFQIIRRSCEQLLDELKPHIQPQS